MTSKDFTIKNIERILLNVPFHPRCAHVKEVRVPGWSIVELCKVETAAGVVGIGEPIPDYTWGASGEGKFAQVIGKNLFDYLWDDSLGAGLQMALFDAAGKSLGVPCHRLLGTQYRSTCPLSWWAQDMKPEEWAAEARAALPPLRRRIQAAEKEMALAAREIEKRESALADPALSTKRWLPAGD